MVSPPSFDRIVDLPQFQQDQPDFYIIDIYIIIYKT